MKGSSFAPGANARFIDGGPAAAQTTDTRSSEGEPLGRAPMGLGGDIDMECDASYRIPPEVVQARGG
jgi:hypothetical protein